MKNLNMYFNKTLISYCIIFETININISIEMVTCLAVDCNSDARQGKNYLFKNFQGKKI